MVEPSKGTFNHPSPRQYFPFVGFDFLGDIDFKSKLFLEFPDKGAAIPCIGAEFFERGVAQTGQCRYRQSGLGIVYIGGMNDDREQIAHHIDDEMSFSAFCFFPPSNPRCSQAYVVLTLCESMMA